MLIESTHCYHKVMLGSGAHITQEAARISGMRRRLPRASAPTARFISSVAATALPEAARFARTDPTAAVAPIYSWGHVIVGRWSSVSCSGRIWVRIFETPRTCDKSTKQLMAM